MSTPMPNARAIEEAILGICIIDPSLVGVIELAPDDFYLDGHQLLWQTLQEMRLARRSIDFATLSDELHARERLANVGGPAYLAGLVAAPELGCDVQEYSRIIRDRADRRRAIQTAQRIARSAFDLDSDFETAKAEALEALVNSSSGTGRMVHISDAAYRLLADISDRAQDPKDVYGLDTGFASLNRITAGFQRGEEIILSGDPGVGKTLLAAQLAAQMAQAGAPGVIFELEMGDLQLVRRVVAAKTGIQPRAMRSGRLEDDEFPVIAAAIEEVAALPVWISDETTWTTTGIRSRLTQLKAKHNVQWFMVDYLMLLTDRYGKDETERTNYISKNLRRICKDLNMAGLVIHSQNKAGIANDRKNVAALAGAVGVGYDADVVIFMTHHILPEADRAAGVQPSHNVRTLTFAKYREDSPDRFLHLTMRPGLPAFADYAPEPNAQRIPKERRP